MTTVSGLPQRVLRLAAILCVAVAAVVLLATTINGAPLSGALAVAGLALGVANGFFIDRLFVLGLPVGATSGLRLMSLSGIALLAALTVGLGLTAWFVAGIAIAQLALAGAAAVVSVQVVRA